MSAWYSRQGEYLTLNLHVQPGAKRNEIVGLHGDALKVRLAAPPIEGRANTALLRFFAERCGVPLSHVELLQGRQSRQKRIAIRACLLDPATLLPGGSDTQC